MEPKWTVHAGLYEQYREETRLVQFLMALRDDFEGVSSSMFYHTPLPTVDSALAELIAEETRKGTTISPKPSYALCFCHTILEIRKSVPNPMQFLSEIWSHGQRLSKTLIHPITCEQNRRAPGYPKQNIVAGALKSSSASISSLEELQSLLGWEGSHRRGSKTRHCCSAVYQASYCG
jgi:hypothetical protein